MTMHRGGDSIGPEAYALEDLRAAALYGKGELARPLALALLGRTSYPQKTRDLTALLRNDEEQPRLRAMAAQFLGEAGTPAAVRALKEGLAIQDDVALRGVLHGLALAGGEEPRAALKPLGRRRGLVGTSVKRIAQLIEHQLGTAGRVEPPPQKLVRVSPKAAVPIEVRRATGKQVGEAIAAAASALPALTLSPRGAMTLQCFDRRLLFLFSEELAQGGVERLAAAKAEAGIVAGRKEREDEGWEVKYHVLTRPAGGDEIDIRVTSGRGRLLYSGTARLRRGRAEFTLRTVDAPGAVAIDVRGTFEDGKLTFTEARSDPRSRRASLRPTPLRPREE